MDEYTLPGGKKIKKSKGKTILCILTVHGDYLQIPVRSSGVSLDKDTQANIKRLWLIFDYKPPVVAPENILKVNLKVSELTNKNMSGVFDEAVKRLGQT